MYVLQFFFKLQLFNFFQFGEELEKLEEISKTVPQKLSSEDNISLFLSLIVFLQMFLFLFFSEYFKNKLQVFWHFNHDYICIDIIK